MLKTPRPPPKMLKTPGRLRVLVADDNPSVLKSVARLLATDHDVVGLVSNGRALLEAAHQLQPDIIVLDLSFTDVESLEACRLITQRDPRIKVIVFTVEDDAAVRRQAFEAGAAAFVNKLGAEGLLSALERLYSDEH
jgi:DNA-binding NarL/FixJ family response regulator